MRRRQLITSKSVFAISLIVIVLTILLVFVSGLQNHRSLYLNSLVSVTILSIAFFLFITIGLYSNFKLKDDLGKILHKKQIEVISRFDPSGGSLDISDVPIGGEDPLSAVIGIFLGIILWLVISFVIAWVIWLFGFVFWITVLATFAMLYWIFFRALRFVFKMAPVCNGYLLKSAGYGLFYTVLYNFWIYGIIFISHYLIK